MYGRDFQYRNLSDPAVVQGYHACKQWRTHQSPCDLTSTPDESHKDTSRHWRSKQPSLLSLEMPNYCEIAALLFFLRPLHHK